MRYTTQLGVCPAWCYGWDRVMLHEYHPPFPLSPKAGLGPGWRRDDHVSIVEAAIMKSHNLFSLVEAARRPTYPAAVATTVTATKVHRRIVARLGWWRKLWGLCDPTRRGAILFRPLTAPHVDSRYTYWLCRSGLTCTAVGRHVATGLDLKQKRQS